MQKNLQHPKNLQSRKAFYQKVRDVLHIPRNKNQNHNTNKQATSASLLSDKSKNLLTKANSAMADKKWGDAADYLNVLVEHLGNNTPVEIWVKLSISLQKQKKYRQAERLVERGMVLFPDNFILLGRHAEIAVADKDWENAITRWEKAISIPGNPKLENVYIAYINTLTNAGKFDLAHKVSAKARTMWKNSMKVISAEAQISMAMKNWDKAHKQWAEAKSMPGAFPAEGWVGLVSSLRNNGQFDDAEKQALLAMENSKDIRVEMEWAEIPTSARKWQEALTRWSFLNDKYAHDPSIEEAHMLHIKFNKSVVGRIVNVGDYVKKIQAYSKSKTKRKIAVVTSYSKGYDMLKLPEYIDDRFDYFAYTDDNAKGFGLFDVKPFPFSAEDNGRTIRYVKTHPHVLFADYETVVWVDASFLITGDIFPLVEEFVKSGKPIASTPHQHRSNIFEEVEACTALKKDDPLVMRKQVAHYKQKGFNGDILAENTILMFNISNKRLAPVMETWWREINKFSKRDQLSFGYSLFKNNADWHHIAEKPTNVRNYPQLVLTPHNTEFPVLNELNRKIKGKLEK